MKIQGFLKKIWQYNPWGVVALVAVAIIASLIQASSVVTIAPVIDLIIHPNLSGISHATKMILGLMKKCGMPTSLMAVMLLFVVIIVCKNCFLAASKYVLYKFNDSFVEFLLNDQYRSILGAGWGFFVQQRHGMLNNTVVHEIQRVGEAGEMVGETFASLLSIVFYLGLGFYVSWKLTMVVLVMLLAGLGPFFLLGRITYRIGKSLTASNNELFSAVGETLNSAKLILGYGNQSKSKEKFHRIVPQYLKNVLRYIMIRETTQLAFEPFSFLIIFSAVYIGTKRFGMNVTELLILLYAFRSICQHGMNIVARRNQLKNLLPAFEQIEQVRAQAISQAQPSGTKCFERFVDRIDMRDIHFNYPGGKQALKGVSLSIAKGRMVAIVGRSGSGKTTLIDVLMGFYTPQKGTFLVDGGAFSKLDITSWRQKMGYIPQESALFNMSIKDNLLWSNEQATIKDIDRVLYMSHAGEFIKDLPAGVDTIVGEHGVRLSGGQRQRLALARAVLRQPELLILDEATSSLDSQSEQLIQQSIEQLAGTVTMVVIAHRFSTIKRADHIYVMEDGRIIEEGTFGTLMSLKDGQFLKTAEIQGVL